MKKMLIPIAMLIVISLSGCETMEGLGRVEKRELGFLLFLTSYLII